MGKTKNKTKPKNNVKIKMSFSQTEKFINLIRDHPPIYDPSLKKHHDRVLLGNLWNKIAKKMDITSFTGKTFLLIHHSFCIYM